MLRYLQLQEDLNPNRPEYLDRPVLVEATWRDEGWRVQAVWLDGVRQAIVGQGRSERNAAGMMIMVEIGDGSRLELLLDEANGQWRLRRAGRPAVLPSQAVR